MRRWNVSRGALSACVTAALLAGCGASQQPIGAPPSLGYESLAKSPAHSKTFVFTGEAQLFTVPTRVRSITVVARGAGGTFYHCLDTGRGARVYAVIPVAKEERLSIYVGGADGFNGGGHGNKQGGSNGGGASDVRTGHGRLRDRILVAAGGGGTGGLTYCFSTGGGYGAGGSGGGLTGGPGSDGMSYGAGSPGGGGSGGITNRGRRRRSRWQQSRVLSLRRQCRIRWDVRSRWKRRGGCAQRAPSVPCRWRRWWRRLLRRWWWRERLLRTRRRCRRRWWRRRVIVR
jgi:hypothetical protein